MNEYIENNKDKFLQELIAFLKIPSISADSKYVEDVRKAANFLSTQFQQLGLKDVSIYETQGHPIVFAQTNQDKSKPTILVYGHYDVQPEDPLDLWDSPPFEPLVKNQRIYARGACDDKGQVYMHIKALEVLQAEHGDLPCNVKFLIEGEEEVGSDNLEVFLSDYKSLLTADMVLISDTSMISLETPSITVGLRGLSYVEVEVVGPNRDLHSGVYGGAVGNPINILCDMISSLQDDNGYITIPGFYDQVRVLSEQERDELAKIPFDEEKYKKDLNVDALKGELGYSTIERTGIRPTLDVNGIWGGYTGEGAKTVLPSKAYAKISMRLVPNQRSEEITRLFKEYFEKIAPKSIKVIVKPHHGGEAAETPTDSPAYIAAEQAIETVFAKKPVPTKDGGSIPIVALFQDVLGLNSLLLGFGLDEDRIHSPNESYGLENYYKGIETIVAFHKAYKKTSLK